MLKWINLKNDWGLKYQTDAAVSQRFGCPEKKKQRCERLQIKNAKKKLSPWNTSKDKNKCIEMGNDFNVAGKGKKGLIRHVLGYNVKDFYHSTRKPAKLKQLIGFASLKIK